MMRMNYYQNWEVSDMPRSVQFKESIQKIRMDLWVKVYLEAESSKPNRFTSSTYADEAVIKFDEKFKTKNLE